MATTEGLSTLLHAGAAQPALAAHLDSLLAAERVAQARGLSGRELGELFARCAGAPPLALTDLVPDEATPAQMAIFCGMNSLPAFRVFEKRFFRAADGVIYGYNHQAMRPFTGPGYFTVRAAGAELLLDYTAVPAPGTALPEGWPAVRDNRGGISTLVFADLQDFCRRVSRDVFIGQATRDGKAMKQYFVLARDRLV